MPQFNSGCLVTASISPDATRLAVALGTTPTGVFVTVYTLPGGKARTWSLTRHQDMSAGIGVTRDNPQILSWTADDRTLEFNWTGLPGPGVRLLDTTAPGNNLYYSSHRILWTYGTGSGSSNFVCDSDAFLTANGTAILCAGYTWQRTAGPTAPTTLGFGEFSATTGKLIAIRAAEKGSLPTEKVRLTPRGQWVSALNEAAFPRLMWASPDGSVLIGTLNGPGHVFVYARGHKQMIPWSPSIAPPGMFSITEAAW